MNNFPTKRTKKRFFSRVVYIAVFFMLLSLICNSQSISADKDIPTKVHQEHKKVQGIDVSHHQGTIDWKKVKEAGVAYVFIKLTQGAGFLDPMFATNWQNANAAGLLCGPYHFYSPNENPESQANFFIASLKNVTDQLSFPPVLDVETYHPEPGFTLVDYQENIKKWLQIVESALKTKPVIYVSLNFANKYLNDVYFSDYHLWLAQYGVKSPHVPVIWESKGWTFWQNTSSDEIDGINGDVDHNILNPTSQLGSKY
jgi:lysozyme